MTTTFFVVIVWILPVVLALVWAYLDASPSLFLYDGLVGPLSLENKTIWITGASSGIGAALVCEVMQAGAKHVILSSRRRDKLEQVANHCLHEVVTTSATTTTKVSILPYDAADPESSDATVEQAIEIAGREERSSSPASIDMVFLNAGMFQSQPARQTSKEERERIWRVNYQSPVDLTESLLSSQNNAATNHIVVTASVMAYGPHGLSSTYAATKAALRNYFHTLAMEEAVYSSSSSINNNHSDKRNNHQKSGGVRIDVALPGLTDTSMWQALETTETTTTTQTIVPTTGAAMTPSRVARLLLSGATGPHFLFYELWIGRAAALLWVWMAHYTPALHHLFCYVLTYIRLPVWIHERLDVMDVPVLLHRWAQLVLGRYP